jgi:hypothetical protein
MPDAILISTALWPLRTVMSTSPSPVCRFCDGAVVKLFTEGFHLHGVTTFKWLWLLKNWEGCLIQRRYLANKWNNEWGRTLESSCHQEVVGLTDSVTIIRSLSWWTQWFHHGTQQFHQVIGLKFTRAHTGRIHTHFVCAR